jgi:hypothetical protein
MKSIFEESLDLNDEEFKQLFLSPTKDQVNRFSMDDLTKEMASAFLDRADKMGINVGKPAMATTPPPDETAWPGRSL